MHGRLLLALAGALALAGHANAACPSAEPILGPLTCSSVTAGHVDYSGTSSLGGTRPSSNSYQCDDGASETGTVVEDVYEFTCPQTGTVTIDLTGLDCDLDLFVIDATCDPDPGCEAGSLAIGTGSETVDVSCVSGDVKYVVVEGWGFGITSTEPGYCSGAASGDYTISFDTTVGTGCGEDCDNGSDDDADGFADCDDTDCAAESVCDYDRDGDGYDGTAYGGTDCDDSSSAVNPGATELCNCVDDDCDGTTDESCGVGRTSPSTATRRRRLRQRSRAPDAPARPAQRLRRQTRPTATTRDVDGQPRRHRDLRQPRQRLRRLHRRVRRRHLVPGRRRDGYGSAHLHHAAAVHPPVGYVSNSTDCNDCNAR